MSQLSDRLAAEAEQRTVAEIERAISIQHQAWLMLHLRATTPAALDQYRQHPLEWVRRAVAEEDEYRRQHDAYRRARNRRRQQYAAKIRHDQYLESLGNPKDQYETMDVTALEAAVGPDVLRHPEMTAFYRACERLPDDLLTNVRTYALPYILRWVLRGLSPEDAHQKLVVNGARACRLAAERADRHECCF